MLMYVSYKVIDFNNYVRFVPFQTFPKTTAGRIES